MSEDTSNKKNIKKCSTSNSFSDGGGGNVFENNVHAYFVALYLAGAEFPYMDGDCYNIHFQGKKLGFKTDDMIVYYKNKNKQKCKILFQIKSTLPFNKSNKDSKKALRSAWEDFQNDKIFEPQDKIVFITPNLSDYMHKHVKPIFEYARSSNDGKAFKTHFEDNAGDKKDKLKTIREVIEDELTITVTDEDLWKFLKVVYLLQYDLDTPNGKDEKNALDKLKNALHDKSDENCKSVWNEIFKVVTRSNPFAADINRVTLERLSPGLTKMFIKQNSSTLTPWRLPHLENFVGNQKYLQEISQRFEKKMSKSLTVVLVGLQGIGKTYLALKTALDLFQNYSYTAWFDAKQSLTQQFLDFAEDHYIDLNSSKSEGKIKQMTSWFSKKDALLIFDNAESYDALKLFLPNNVHTLITSLDAMGWSVFNTIQINSMERKDAIDLLGLELDSSSLQGDEIDSLVDMLGGLPLAIAQAGAYIRATSINVSKYLDNHRLQRTKMLKDSTLKESGKAKESVYVTFEISINKVRTELSTAYDLLSLCAFFNSNNIPRKVIVKAIRTEDNLTTDSEQEVKILNKYSLVQAKEDFISVHCVVQDVVHEKIRVDRKSYLGKLLDVLKLLDKEFRYDRNDRKSLDMVKQLIPHLIHVKQLAVNVFSLQESDSLDKDIKLALGKIIYHIGNYYLDHFYDGNEAKELMIKAKQFVPSSESSTVKKINLCLLKSCISKACSLEFPYGKNEELYRAEFIEAGKYKQELLIYEKDCIDVNCAFGHYYKRKPSKKPKPEEVVKTAEKYYKQALKIAIADNNNGGIGMVYHYLGNLYLDAGNKKVNTANRMNDDWGEKRRAESKEYYRKAQNHFKQSLHYKRKVYEENHLEIARANKLLGESFFKLKEHREAEIHLQEALDAYESFYGGEPRKDIAVIYSTLAYAYLELDNPQKSREFFNKALEQYENLPGDYSKEIKEINTTVQEKLDNYTQAQTSNRLHVDRSSKRVKTD